MIIFLCERFELFFPENLSPLCFAAFLLGLLCRTNVNFSHSDLAVFLDLVIPFLHKNE